MIVKLSIRNGIEYWRFESSVNSYDSQTVTTLKELLKTFESSVNSYDSQTFLIAQSKQ